MSIAPEPILRAGNDTVSWACIFCRNQTLREGAAAARMRNSLTRDYIGMQTLTLRYKLDGAGWATATIVTPKKVFDFAPSYLFDALGDLVRELVGIAKARRSEPPFVFEQRVEWFGEPVGLDLIFETQQDRGVRLQLVQMPDEVHRRIGRQVLLDDQIDFDIFAHSVRGEALRILQVPGAQGYKEKWKLHDFPEGNLRKLRQFLDMPINSVLTRYGLSTRAPVSRRSREMASFS